MSTYKPQGLPDVSAYVMLSHAVETLAFLRQVFGATEGRRFELPDGTIAHVELRIGDSVVMFSQATSSWPATPTWLHVYVPDVRATHQLALEHGAKEVQAPVQRPGDPDCRGGFLDPSGNTWWVSTQVS